MAIVSEPVRREAAANRSLEYQVVLRRLSDGREFPGAVVPPSAFVPALHLALFDAVRQGVLDEFGDTTCASSEPVFADGDEDRVIGLTVTVRGAARQSERKFGLEVFEAAAQADLARLLKTGQLGDDKQAVFRIVAKPAAPANAAESAVDSRIRRNPPTLLEGRLADWLDRATPCGPVEPRDYPLFIRSSALDRAREYSFKPDRNEGGAMLMGHLHRQRSPEPEVFGVVDVALELRYARHERFALVPTPETLADLKRQWTLRQTRLGRPHEVPLALSHSHDFLPSLAEDGAANCPSCRLRPSCQIVSAFYSAGDVQFHTGLFSKQPWVAGLVFGLTPREERIIRMFVLEGGRARERGYYVVQDRPEQE